MPFNIDKTVECIKALVDNNRCVTCDNIGGERLRYQCGHCFCCDCVANEPQCLLCLTPPNAASQTPLIDTPATERASNADKLLNAFQDTFTIDVNKRSRLSEQLKVEKEVFPECIQAPIKYYNKRKSSIFKSNKENRKPSFLPGELISPVKSAKMEKSFNYVQNWLDNNDEKTSKKSARKPFADLNINTSNTIKRKIPKRADLILEKVDYGIEKTPIKRRKSNKSVRAVVESQSLLDAFHKPAEKESVTKELNKTDKDESGIVIDEDSIIDINDSQSEIVDKDKLAWLAVLEANERSPYDSQSVQAANDNLVSKNDYQIFSYKVPFYKRSYLIETCNLCNASKSDKVIKNEVAGQLKDVSVTIESNRFITTVKIYNASDKPVFEKHSMSIQTDTICNLDSYDKMLDKPPQKLQELVKDVTKEENNSSANNESDVPSQDLFTAEMKNGLDKVPAEKVSDKQLVIAESDSDDAGNESSIIQVTAEVHHSSEHLEHGVLAELKENNVQQRAKRIGRALTINSSDSSEKENFDPNRTKRIKLDEKDTKKRKRILKMKKFY